MTLKGPEMSKQGTVGKRKHITLMIPLDQVAKGEERLWLYATLDYQLSYDI